MYKKTVKYRRAYAYSKFRAYIKTLKRKKRKYRPILPIKTQKNNKNNQFISRNFENPIKLLAPVDFSLEIDKIKVIKFLTKVRQTYKQRYDKVFVDLSQVERIDLCTIVMLLSVMDYLSQRGVFVQGNFPNNEEAYNLIKDTKEVF